MRLRPRYAALGLATVLYASVAAGQTPMFLLDSESGISTLIFRVNRITGQLTNIGSLPVDLGEAVGLAAANNNLLYVTTSQRRLIEVTVSPFSYTDLGIIGVYLPGLAYYGGALYGLEEPTDQLVRVQISPPSATPVGTVRNGSATGPTVDLSGGDLAVNASGDWYMWTNNPSDLFRLDINTAVATQLDPASTSPSFKNGIAFDFLAGDALYAVSRADKALQQLDLTSGQSLSSVTLCLNCPTPYDVRVGDLATVSCTDLDRDGFAVDGPNCGPRDCNDSNPDINPGEIEKCNNVDDNCNDTVDEGAASEECSNACTATAQCVRGTCVTTPIDCEDGNPCTINTCDPTLGCQSMELPNGTSCSDGNVCTGEEICNDGVCSNPPDLDCDDDDSCTSDSCTPPIGCRNRRIPGCCTSNADCADASPCTTNERCAGGQCISDCAGACMITGTFTPNTRTPTRTVTMRATPTATPTPTPTRTAVLERRGDLNNDGQANGEDLALLIAAIYSPNPPSAADLNGDGSTTAADVPEMLGLFDSAS